MLTDRETAVALAGRVWEAECHLYSLEHAVPSPGLDENFERSLERIGVLKDILAKLSGDTDWPHRDDPWFITDAERVMILEQLAIALEDEHVNASVTIETMPTDLAGSEHALDSYRERIAVLESHHPKLLRVLKAAKRRASK